MPTHTPSPHRFLAPKAPSSHAKPTPSGLRNVLASKTPKQKETPQKVELQSKKLTPAKQFVLGPGQHARKKSADDGERLGGAGANVDVQATPRLQLKPKRTFARVESIEESQSSPVATQEDNVGGGGVLLSIELDDSNETDDEEEMLFNPTAPHKRRRISTSASPPPPLPHTPAPGPSHRFKPPAPRTPAPFTRTPASPPLPSTTAPTPAPTAASNPTPAPHRPHFILPTLPPSPQKPSKPLPEIFSPSRKSGKYLPHGLAATATGWIIDMAGAAAAQQGVVWGREREDGVKMRVRVAAVCSGRRRGGVVKGGEDGMEGEREVGCFAGGVVYVCGTTEPGLYNASRAVGALGAETSAEVRVLLAGQGGVKGAGGVRLKVGSVVGIRQPLWEVLVEGETWIVGVDWVVSPG